MYVPYRFLFGFQNFVDFLSNFVPELAVSNGALIIYFFCPPFFFFVNLNIAIYVQCKAIIMHLFAVLLDFVLKVGGYNSI